MSRTPYMPLWVSDFLGDTVDLDAAETGAYLCLLMAQWTRGGRSLPRDMSKLARIARCGRNWPRVWAAIGKFFAEDEDGFYSPKGRSVHANVAAKSEVNAQNGALGGAAKALKTKKAALANASHSPKRNHGILYLEPYSKEKEEPKGSLSNPPAARLTMVDACLDHFNATADAVGWPKVQKLTQPRRAALTQRIKDVGGSVAWKEAIDRAAASPHLTGQNNRQWRASFDWLCKAANFTKLMEGNYDPAPQPTRRPRPDAREHQGDHAEMRQYRPDPALVQIARLARLGAASGHDRG